MPHIEVIKAINEAVSSQDFEPQVASRVLAYLEQAETSEFPNRDREQQLSLILNALPSLGMDELPNIDDL